MMKKYLVEDKEPELLKTVRQCMDYLFARTELRESMGQINM